VRNEIFYSCARGNPAGRFAGTGIAADKMTDAQIQEKLKADGYTNVQITEHDKDHVDVKATKNGKTEKLAVNPQTGAVTPDTDND
jgi:hypothetical protein